MTEAVVTDADRIQLLNQKERSDKGILIFLRNALVRKLKSLIGSEEEYRFQTFDIEDLAPYCSDQKIKDLRSYAETKARDLAPEWAVIVSFLINNRGALRPFLTRIPTQHHPIHKQIN